MSLFGSLFETRARTEGPYSLSSDGVTSIFTAGPGNPSGVVVNETSALNCTAVLACIRIISFVTASLPLELYRVSDDGGKRSRERAIGDPRRSLLRWDANPEMDSFAWEQAAVTHLLSWGNHYSYIERRRDGRAVALWPLAPNRVQVDRVRATRELVYRYDPDDADPVAIGKVLRQSDVLHFKGLSTNGHVGLSVIQANRDTIGLAMAQTKHGAAFFGNSARPAGIIRSEVPLKAEARKRLREQWNEAHQGSEKAFGTAVMDGNLSWTPITLPSKDVEWLESRKFSVEEVCMMFGVPPVVIGFMEKSTSWGSGIEQVVRGFSTVTLRPLYSILEGELRRKLLSEKEWPVLEFRHDVKELARGDLKTMFEAAREGVAAGVLTPNEGRAELDFNPSDEPAADELFIQGANRPLRLAGKEFDGAATQGGDDGGGADASDASQSDEESDSARTLALAREWLQPVLQRQLELLVEREVKAVRKGFEGRDVAEFMEWLEEYYRKVPEFVEATAGEALASTMRATGRDGEASVACEAAGYAEAHRYEILNAIRSSADRAHDSRTAVDLLLDRWAESEAADLAASFFDDLDKE